MSAENRQPEGCAATRRRQEKFLPLRDTADVLSLDHAAYLLGAALEADRRRRWWQLPNRLWVGRVEMALGIVTRASEAVRGR